MVGGVSMDEHDDTTTDRFNELQSRAIENIHDEAESAMKQAEGWV